MTRIITLEGNIGSGKSTFNRALEEYFKNEDNCCGLKICFLLEPVDIWNTIKDSDGRTMIECYYADQERYAFPFQMMAYISRLHILREEYKKNYDIIFTERCLFTDQNVFAKMLYDDGKIGEVEGQIYNKWFHEFIAEFPEMEYVYMKTTPEVALSRIVKRARPGENIPLEYLEKCHNYHEAWLEQHANKCVLDGNIDSTENTEIVTIWINTVNDLIHTYHLKFDGASKGNPGQCGAGFVIYKNDEKIYEGKKYVALHNTNNFAEYSALILGLEECVKIGIKRINIMGDSNLVIKQIQDIYKVESKNLVPLYNEVIGLFYNFDHISFKHIPRNNNTEADALANAAIIAHERESPTHLEIER
jgi:ribonuclease HI/deoxyadenosine/deoxycytidine kinase